MTDLPEDPKALLRIVDESLDLLETQRAKVRQEDPSVSHLPSLLEQFREVRAGIEHRKPEPVRLINHFACTGGTLICKFLAVMPNARLLSEIDPLSPAPSRDPAEDLEDKLFAPTDLIRHFRDAPRGASEAELLEVFQAALAEIYSKSSARGEYLIIRTHPHSQFCYGDSVSDRATVKEIIADEFSVCSVLTVRHPLDSYLSLNSNGWLHFSPSTLDSYAQRYLAFLDAHEGEAIFKYEDFVEDHEGFLKKICLALKLEYLPGMSAMTELVQLSGDSGRKGTIVAKRPRREIPDEIEQQRTTSESYHRLCETLGYTP